MDVAVLTPMSMDLTQLTGKPELTVTISEKEYHFSEFTIDALAELQSWVRKHTPHPIDEIKEHLDGLPAEDRRYLLDKARADAKDWPPKVGTPAGALALLGSPEGQIETIYRGLLTHQPHTTIDDARAIYRTLVKAKAEGTITKVVGVLFGLDPDDAGATPGPKGGGAPPSPSTGP